MPVIINNAKVKTLLPSATDEQIALYDGLFDDAEACLSSFPQGVQDLVVALAVAHMLTFSNGGQVKSETTRTGASATYETFSGNGLLSTQYGNQLNGIPAAQCILGLFSQPQRFARSINPHREGYY